MAATLEISIAHPQGKFIIRKLSPSATTQQLADEFKAQTLLPLFPCGHGWQLTFFDGKSVPINSETSLVKIGIFSTGIELQVCQPHRQASDGSELTPKIAIFRPGDIQVPSFHVSCQSDRLEPSGTDGVARHYVGILLLDYDGRNDWNLGGVHCRAGYIYLKEAESVTIFNTKVDTLHAKCYFSLFGRELDEKTTGCGFSLIGGKFHLDCQRLGEGGTCAIVSTGSGSKAETICILQALFNWHKTGNSNWQLESSDTHRQLLRNGCQDCIVEQLTNECLRLFK